MKILAVDQSFTSCGIMALDYEDGVDAYNIIHFERYVSNPETDTFTRAWVISQHIINLALTLKVDYTALEGLAFSKIGNATRDLAGLQFVIVTTLRYVGNQNVIIIPPNNVKKMATGKGNAKKEEMYEALPQDVKNRLTDANLKKTTGRYDLTDAYWIGRSAIEIKKTGI